MTPAESLKRQQSAAARGALEDALAQQLRAAHIDYWREFTLPGRKYRWDFAFPNHRLMVEVQGGIWRAKGAHNTGDAITRDCEKSAVAAVYGWRTFGVTAGQINSGQALRWIEQALGMVNA